MSAAVEWDARAELAVGVLVNRYIRENPPPVRTQVYADFAEWAELLEADGRARLCELGGRPLAVARERELLLAAPVTNTDRDHIDDMYPIAHPSRTVRVAQIRAASRLDDLGLTNSFKQYRGERRVYVRLTALGAEVVARYGDELREGKRIRWPKTTQEES